MPALSTNILREHRSGRTSPDSMHQPDNPNRCLLYRPCTNPYRCHYDDRSHRRCSTPNTPPPSPTAISIIPVTTSEATTETTTSPTPTTEQHSLSGLSNATPSLAIPVPSDVDSTPTYLHCDRTFISRIGLVGHLRIRCTATDVPLSGVATCTRNICLHLAHCTRTFTCRMGVFGHMRIHNSRIRRDIDKYNAPYTSTNPPPIPSPVDTPSTSAPTTNSATPTTDPTSQNISYTYCCRSPFHASRWSATLKPIAQRLANQCLEHRNTPDVIASTVFTAPSVLSYRMGLFAHVRSHENLR
ncbi:hypothetical protein SprV_0200875500 [Sparganum proliferum]